MTDIPNPFKLQKNHPIHQCEEFKELISRYRFQKETLERTSKTVDAKKLKLSNLENAIQKRKIEQQNKIDCTLVRTEWKDLLSKLYSPNNKSISLATLNYPELPIDRIKKYMIRLKEDKIKQRLESKRKIQALETDKKLLEDEVEQIEFTFNNIKRNFDEKEYQKEQSYILKSKLVRLFGLLEVKCSPETVFDVLKEFANKSSRPHFIDAKLTI